MESGEENPQFEWDADKERLNFRRHGVTFYEAGTVFSDALSVLIRDEAHSVGEQRFVVIGFSRGGRLLIVVHSRRGTRIRIISARVATRRERRFYEEDFL